MTSTTYVAPGLEKREIRLLTLHPCGGAPTVHSTLKTFSIDNVPSYIALSYTWGPKERTAIVIVNNHPVRVRENLKDALQHIQSESEPISIWVDAICIDQNNDSEKTHQVQMMCEIYKQALEVFAWIGSANDGSDEAMERVEDIGQKAIQAGIEELYAADNESWFTPTTDARLSRLRFGLEELVGEEGLVAALLTYLPRLFEREYWSRVWVAQEISVAGQVRILCGKKHLAFPTFHAASDLYAFIRARFPWQHRSLGFRDPVFGPQMEAIISKTQQDLLYKNLVFPRRIIGVRTGYKKQENLEILLKRICYSWLDSEPLKCTDPRDKIYGVLNLASDTARLGIRPDYARTTTQVYSYITRALVSRGQTTVLSWSLQTDRMNGLPSWVPDFSAPIREPRGEDTLNGPLFQASGNSAFAKTTVCSCQTDNILGLSGTKIDRIEQLGLACKQQFNVPFNRVTAMRFLEEIKDFCIASALYNTQAQIEDAKMRIPCADQECYFGSNRRRVSNLSGLREDYGSLELPGKFVDEESDRRGGKYKSSMAYQHGRKPFLSEDGHVGLAPSTSKPGDLICIIFGATVPFILRPIANEKFVLVGEGYVYGVMDGEWLGKSRLVETFHLC